MSQSIYDESKIAEKAVEQRKAYSDENMAGIIRDHLPLIRDIINQFKQCGERSIRYCPDNGKPVTIRKRTNYWLGCPKCGARTTIDYECSYKTKNGVDTFCTLFVRCNCGFITWYNEYFDI